MARFRAVIELLAACAAAVGCAISWSAVRSTVAVAPVAKDQPVTASVVYDPALLLLTLLLATAAGILAVLAVAQLRRARRPLNTWRPAEPSSGRQPGELAG